MTSEIPDTTPEAEHQFHYYSGNRIPWYVRGAWLLFWMFAIYYAVTYLIPDLQRELLPR